MDNLADAIALQALWQAYLRWIFRTPNRTSPYSRERFAHTYKCHPLPAALPALWR